MRNKNIIFGVAIILFMALPPVKNWIESSMVGQMLVQIPSLVIAGTLISRGLNLIHSMRISAYNAGGLPGTLLAIFVIAFWILPRWVDASLNEPLVALAKFITLPILAGIPLYFSWSKLGAISKGFIWSNLISMLIVMGWLYLAAPIRLCNNYLVEQQYHLGWSMLTLATLIFVYWIFKLFTGHGLTTTPESEPLPPQQSPPHGSSENQE